VYIGGAGAVIMARRRSAGVLLVSCTTQMLARDRAGR